MPTAAAEPKHINCLLVMFSASLLFTRLRSIGIAVKAMVSVTENFFQRVL
jgi:hypothetical protein